MARITSQHYSSRRGTYGRQSLLCDTGTAPGRVSMGGFGAVPGMSDPVRLTIIAEDKASEARFKLELRPEEVVRLATIILGPVLADLAEEARAKLAKVVK